MKKQTAMFLSFTALLTISAFAPHVFWQADKTNRFPASLEEDRLEELAQKKEVPKLSELKAVEIKSQEVKLVEVDAQVSCLKEAQPKELEAEVKKLMEDKEAILKELAELKKAKNTEEKKEDIKEDDKKKIVKTDYNQDILGIMSQLTSLMVSQQQQQMSMMTQMFSMFQMQQPKQTSSWNSPMSDYMSPYAFNASNFEFPRHQSIYSLSGLGNNIGLGYSGGGMSEMYGEALSARTPAQFDNQPMFDRSHIESESFQPRVLTPKDMVPHNGYDFRPGTDALNMKRVQF